MLHIIYRYIHLAKENLIIVDQGVVSLSRFLLTLIIAKSLGVSQYGTYVILWSYILFLGSIQIPFIINPLMTLGAKVINKENPYFFSSYFHMQVLFSLISVGILSLIYVISLFLFESFDNIIFTGLVFYGVSYNFYEFYRRYFFTIAKEGLVLWINIFVHLTLLSFFGFLMINELLNLRIYFFTSFLIYFIAIICLHRFTDFPAIKFNFLTVRLIKNISYAAPMLKLSIMQFLSGHIFIYVAYFILGDYSAGVIGALRNIFAPLIVGLMVLDNAMPRKAMYYYEKEAKGFLKYLNLTLQKWGVVFLLFITTLMIFGKSLIEIIYGPEYIEFTIYIGWFALSHLAMLMNRVLSIYCRTINKMNVFSKQGLFSFVFTLTTTYPLIKLLGLNGAFAIMFTQQIIMLIIIVKDSKYYEFIRK